MYSLSVLPLGTTLLSSANFKFSFSSLKSFSQPTYTSTVFNQLIHELPIFLFLYFGTNLINDLLRLTAIIHKNCILFHALSSCQYYNWQHRKAKIKEFPSQNDLTAIYS